MLPRRDRPSAHRSGVVVCVLSGLLFACVPKPVVPSGDARVPVNSEEVINQYRERVKVDQRDRLERSVLTQQVDTLTKQLQELKAYVTLLQLQLQQTEGERTRVRQVRAVSPPLVGRVVDPPGSPAPVREVERITTPMVAGPAGKEAGIGTYEANPKGDAPTVPSLSEAERVRPVGLPRRPTERVVQLASVTGLPSPPALPPPAPVREELLPELREPQFVKLGEREEMEVHSNTVIFRVSEGKGLSTFTPTAGLRSYLTKAIMLGQCIQVRGYTDGDEDAWYEQRTARLRAEKARAYLIDNGFSPLNIDVKVFPVGEHIADNASGEGRAKNRRVEIEFMDINPASVWPQWNG